MTLERNHRGDLVLTPSQVQLPDLLQKVSTALDIIPDLNTISLGLYLWHQGLTRLSKPRQDGHCLRVVGRCRAAQPVLLVLRYSLYVHAHHHAQGGVPCHGKVVPVVPQSDGVQPVLHSQAGGQVQEAPVKGCLGEPGSRKTRG